jgi:molecular chaperone Hsp33
VRQPDDRDTLQRFVFENARVRGEVVRLDTAWETISRRHAYPEPVIQLLGELTAASVLLAATLKFDKGLLTLQLKSEGAIRLLVVDCQADHTVRAMARWDSEQLETAKDQTLRGLTRNGQCAITLDPGSGHNAYQSVVSLDAESVTSALESYMARSEQLDTRFALAANGLRATGILLQKIPAEGGHPATDDADIWTRTGMLLSTITDDEMIVLPSQEILRRLFHQESLRLFESTGVQFGCRCSAKRVASMLRMMGRAEIEAVLAERGEVEVSCEFCGERYAFGPDETEALLSSAGLP